MNKTDEAQIRYAFQTAKDQIRYLRLQMSEEERGFTGGSTEATMAVIDQALKALDKE